MTYKLELTPPSCLHPVFHALCLNKVINDKIPVQIILHEINEEEKTILELESIFETMIK